MNPETITLLDALKEIHFKNKFKYFKIKERKRIKPGRACATMY